VARLQRAAGSSPWDADLDSSILGAPLSNLDAVLPTSLILWNVRESYTVKTAQRLGGASVADSDSSVAVKTCAMIICRSAGRSAATAAKTRSHFSEPPCGHLLTIVSITTRGSSTSRPLNSKVLIGLPLENSPWSALVSAASC
jgi:hypothetical protein